MLYIFIAIEKDKQITAREVRSASSSGRTSDAVVEHKGDGQLGSAWRQREGPHTHTLLSTGILELREVFELSSKYTTYRPHAETEHEQ
jgi:hypothetical protein